MAHKMTLMTAEITNLRKANEALSKRRRAKKTRVRLGGALTIQDGLDEIARKEAERLGGRNRAENGRDDGSSAPRQRRCGRCGKTGDNSRTCKEDIESSLDSDSE